MVPGNILYGMVHGGKMGKKCENCGRVENSELKLMKCARCRGVTYCNAKCQQASWKQHKGVCFNMKVREGQDGAFFALLQTITGHQSPEGAIKFAKIVSLYQDKLRLDRTADFGIEPCTLLLLVVSLPQLDAKYLDEMLKYPKKIGLNKPCLANGWTPLMWAFERNNFTAASKLLEHRDIDITHVSEVNQYTVMHKAMECAHTYVEYLPLLKKLVAHPDCRLIINRRDRTLSPLFFCIARKHLPVLKILLSHPDIDVNRREVLDGVILTPFAFACSLRDLEMVEVLLQHGDVRVNERMSEGSDAAMPAMHTVVALKDGFLKVKILELIFKYCPDVDVNIVSSMGMNLLQHLLGLVLEFKEDGPCDQMDVVTTILIEKGIDINHVDKLGNSVLMYAMRKPVFLKVVKALTSAPSLNVNYKNGIEDMDMGQTALEIGFNSESWDCFDHLVTHPDIDLAVEFKSCCILANLIYHLVLKQRHQSLRLVLRHPKLPKEELNYLNGSYTPLMIAVENGFLECVKVLVEHGCDLNHVEQECHLIYASCFPEIRYSALYSSISEEHSEIFDLLIDAGVRCEARDYGKSNPLYMACISGDLHMVRRLLLYGDFHLSASNFTELLKEAKEYEKDDVVKYLRDTKGFSKLHFAIDVREERQVEAILSADGNSSLCNDKNNMLKVTPQQLFEMGTKSPSGLPIHSKLNEVMAKYFPSTTSDGR